MLALPPIAIPPTTPFSALLWLCPLCAVQVPLTSKSCLRRSCPGAQSSTCLFLDRRGCDVDRSPFPASWICCTCSRTHWTADILLRRPAEELCTCGKPALQAVYDQFGSVFLFWRDDEEVRDLRLPEKVDEAARRLWIAGGDRWMEELDVDRIEEKEEKEKVQVEALRAQKSPNVSAPEETPEGVGRENPEDLPMPNSGMPPLVGITA